MTSGKWQVASGKCSTRGLQNCPIFQRERSSHNCPLSLRERVGERASAARLWLLVIFLATLFGGCSRPFNPATDEEPPEKLAAYGLFKGNGASQEPVAGVIPYDLNSALFSDYTTKRRFIKLPAGVSATYNDSEAFDFPVGTIIAKTFSYPHDMTDPSQGERLLETRILMHTPTGWVGMPYVWNAQQTEATLELAGSVTRAEWVHSDGQPRTNDYLIPNVNQCKGCHKAAGEKMTPIGPKARHLNRDLIYHDGPQPATENQLAHWTRVGALKGAPQPEAAPRLAVWDDERSGTLNERARAWLEINCAHCHNPNGHARNAGLDLTASQHAAFQFGIFKPPVAAGRGSGGLQYDIVPGQPDESILAYRIASTHPDVMMPELGKRLVHDEGVALIRQWITAMKGENSKK